MAEKEESKDTLYSPKDLDTSVSEDDPRYRPFPVIFRDIADGEEARVIVIDLRDLSYEELEELIPYNHYAFLEQMYRDARNIQ